MPCQLDLPTILLPLLLWPTLLTLTSMELRCRVRKLRMGFLHLMPTPWPKQSGPTLTAWKPLHFATF